MKQFIKLVKRLASILDPFLVAFFKSKEESNGLFFLKKKLFSTTSLIQDLRCMLEPGHITPPHTIVGLIFPTALLGEAKDFNLPDHVGQDL